MLFISVFHLRLKKVGMPSPSRSLSRNIMPRQTKGQTYTHVGAILLGTNTQGSCGLTYYWVTTNKAYGRPYSHLRRIQRTTSIKGVAQSGLGKVTTTDCISFDFDDMCVSSLKNKTCDHFVVSEGESPAVVLSSLANRRRRRRPSALSPVPPDNTRCWRQGQKARLAPDRHISVSSGHSSLHATGKTETRPIGRTSSHQTDLSMRERRKA